MQWKMFLVMGNSSSWIQPSIDTSLEILFVVKNKFVDTTELCFVTSHPHPTSDVNFATSFVMDSFLM